MGYIEDSLAAIEAQSRMFEQAYRAKEPGVLVSRYFAPDAFGPMAYSPEGVVSGHRALVAMFATQMEHIASIALELVDLRVDGDTAIEWGRAHLVTLGGERETGRYSVGWTRIDGEWRALRDFFC